MTTPGTTESHAPALVILGGPCGLAWAAGLRGFMAQITDVASVSWSGTFGYILLPGIVIGVLLGWAEHLRRTGGRRGWRWLALSPLPSFQRRLARSARHLRGGIGGGALGVPLFAVAGGYACSRRGPRWGRSLAGALALTAIPIWALTVESFAGPELAVDNARGLWVALYYYSFIAVFSVAASMPHRAPVSGGHTRSASPGLPHDAVGIAGSACCALRPA